jgi:DNA-binding beta-propeller fold protein YncE
MPARGHVPSALFAVVVAAIVALSGSQAFAQPSYAPPNINDVPSPYQTILNWGQIPDGRKWGATAGVTIGPDGNIWTYERCGSNSCADSNVDPIFEIDQKTGAVLRHFGKGLFSQPHGLSVDHDGNVWVTDGEGKNGKGHQVFKFSPDGQILLRLGKPGVAGPGLDVFDAPNAVLVAPNGDIYVAEGHAPTLGNSRVLKFDKTGKFLKVVGSKGEGAGEFMEPHALAMDSTGRLFVGDRSNNRIQIFDRDGKFITAWKQFGRPSGMVIRNDILYVSDSESHADRPGTHGYNPGCDRGFRIGSVKDGKVTAFIPNPDGLTGGSEGIGVDHDGNVYGAARIAAEAGRLEKFTLLSKP